MSNIYDFDKIQKTGLTWKHFTKNCRTKNFFDFERDETDTYLWNSGLLNVEDKGMTICEIMNRYLIMFFRGGEANVAQF